MAIWGCLPCLVCQELGRAAMERKKRKESKGGGWGRRHIPNLLPQKKWGKRKMWLKKEVCAGDSEKTGEWLLAGKNAFFFPVMRDKQTYNLTCGMSQSEVLDKNRVKVPWNLLFNNKNSTVYTCMNHLSYSQPLPGQTSSITDPQSGDNYQVTRVALEVRPSSHTPPCWDASARMSTPGLIALSISN